MKFTQEHINTKELFEIDSLDWQQILTLRSDAFVIEQQCLYLDPDDVDVHCKHVYIKSESKIAAYARFYFKDQWFIGRVLTHPEFRRRGLANLLMNHCLQYIMAINANARIELSAQVYLSDFYATLRFLPEGKMYLEDGIPHIKMVYSPNA